MARLTIRQLAGNTWLIPAPANIGVYVRDKRATLIDSGNDEEAGRQILKLLDEQGWTLELIVNTHSNADHIGGNAFLQKRTGCRIAATPLEAAFIVQPLLEPTVLYGGFPLPALRNKFLLAKPSTVTDLLPAAGPILASGLEALPLPGHYLEMIGVRTPDDVLFLADSLFAEAILAKYPLFFLYDVQGHLETLARLDGVTAGCYVPSHGEPTADLAPLVAANRRRLAATLDFVRACCATPVSWEGVLERVCLEYGIELNANQYVLVGSTLRSLLAYLVVTGEVTTVFAAGTLQWQRVG
ncbi:hydrolase [Geotalea uraniireducens]|uniref:Hydrolase n=1 Tax=Geotalea uraniireducens TaxID=351604 RepID=A0ABN6VXG1_9BACT|nr:MBL fold metallo-hydrolase [Geotalea uraniireducens]BDV44612.1 hydrolase [Geotalea uraniireducens]